VSPSTGQGAFRRFKDQLSERQDLMARWHAFAKEPAGQGSQLAGHAGVHTRAPFALEIDGRGPDPGVLGLPVMPRVGRTRMPMRVVRPGSLVDSRELQVAVCHPAISQFARVGPGVLIDEDLNVVVSR
jgi:hypothetical protein